MNDWDLTAQFGSRVSSGASRGPISVAPLESKAEVT